jgi:hypothetical protein
MLTVSQTCETPSPQHVLSRLAAWRSNLFRSHDEGQLEVFDEFEKEN